MPGTTVMTAAAFTRPADTTAYASGDLVANSTTAGSVAPITVPLGAGPAQKGMIRRVSLVKSNTSATNAAFRVHFYTAAGTITFANGDNGAWSTDRAANYLGYCDIAAMQAFTDGCSGQAAPAVGYEINFRLGASVAQVYAVLEARGAYTPASGETFTLSVEAVLE